MKVVQTIYFHNRPVAEVYESWERRGDERVRCFRYRMIGGNSERMHGPSEGYRDVTDALRGLHDLAERAAELRVALATSGIHQPDL